MQYRRVILAGIGVRLAIYYRDKSPPPVSQGGRGNTGGRIASTAEAVTRIAARTRGKIEIRERNGPANCRVRSLPRGELCRSLEHCSGCFHSAQIVDGEHERGEK